MKPTQCTLDIVPPRLLTQVLDMVGLDLLSIVNSSLLSGIASSCFKHAVVQPLLKKSNLDSSDLKNYRPISKLSFQSKMLSFNSFLLI